MSNPNNSTPGLRGHACIKTADGHPVSITSLVTCAEDIEESTGKWCHGIGLLDTDFLFIGRNDLPGEDEQFAIYKEAVSKAGIRPVTVRTCSLSAGQMPGIDTPAWERNPDLGLKGLRLGLANPATLKPQLRAISRANALGHIHLLLPMVSTPREVKQFKKLLKETESELANEHINYRPVTELGLMADLPSVTVNTTQFCYDVSFFQVGEALRNYTMGADFSPQGLEHLKHQFEPMFLFQIQNLAQIATQKNKIVSVSANLASLPEAIPILLAVGVQDLVMRPQDMGPAAKLIENITIVKAKNIGAKAMSYWSGEDVQKYAYDSMSRYKTI